MPERFHLVQTAGGPKPAFRLMHQPISSLQPSRFFFTKAIN
jgi:hypothetical protein